MEVVETKSIQAVQAAISFPGHVKIGLTGNQELQKERELEDLIKDLGNLKLELEAKDSAHKQALIELERHQKAADELSNLLRKCDLKKQFYVNESKESNDRVNELEAAMKQMANQVMESEKVQEQLSRVVSDLVSAESQILNMEAQMAIMWEARSKAVSQAEAMESALREEKHKSEVLTRRVSETKNIFIELKKRILEIERQKASAVAEKQGELELADKEVECMKKQLENMHDLQNQLESNAAVISLLQGELNRVNEQHVSSQKAVSDATDELNKLEEDLELQQKKISEQLDQIKLLEAELKQSRTELVDTRAEVNCLNEQLEQMRSDLEKEQVEVALLKFELHKGKSRLAAAEARAHSSKSVLNNSETYPENPVSNSGNEHEGFINGKDVQTMKKELGVATLKIGQLRTRAAQAISRAEAAEKAKAAMEDQMRKSKEHNSVVIDEESISMDTGSTTSHDSSAKSTRQPLLKVLDIKF